MGNIKINVSIRVTCFCVVFSYNIKLKYFRLTKKLFKIALKETGWQGIHLNMKLFEEILKRVNKDSGKDEIFGEIEIDKGRWDLKVNR